MLQTPKLIVDEYKINELVKKEVIFIKRWALFKFKNAVAKEGTT